MHSGLHLKCHFPDKTLIFSFVKPFWAFFSIFSGVGERFASYDGNNDDVDDDDKDNDKDNDDDIYDENDGNNDDDYDDDWLPVVTVTNDICLTDLIMS